MTATSTALVVHRAAQSLSKETKADIWAQAAALIRAKMFPEKFATQEEAFLVALYGHEIGLSPQRAWKQIHLIKGQPALEVHLQVALVRQAVPGLIWKVVEHTEEKCVIEHGRSAADVQRTEFTFAEAEAAGLTKPTRSGAPSTWMKHRKDMLYARAAGRAVRWFYPETQGGGLIHNVDEMRDTLVHAPTATPEDGVEEARNGAGRMPKRPVPGTPAAPLAPAPAAAPAEAEVAPALADGKVVEAEVVAGEPAVEQVDEAAVLDLVAILAKVTEPKGLDQAYAAWRTQHEKKPATLVAGYEAKELRLKALSA